jgi:signal transduction histidine kinase
VLHSKIGCGLALVLMPAGFVLDWFVYPDHMGVLFLSRLLCDVGVAVILASLFTSFGARNIRVLGIAWALLPAAAIAWMIYYREGAESPYYAGLNLVIIAVTLLMPWTLGEVLATCAITLLFYAAACLGHQAFHVEAPGEFPLTAFANNVYFIVLTAVISGTGAMFLSRLRFQDYRLRHELAQRNTELATSYEKLTELDRLKSQFFANVSHELRTPLTLIISPLDDAIKSGGTGKPEMDEVLRIARDNGLRLLRLINDLLDLVRLEERGADLTFQPENLTTFVPGIVNSASQLAKAKNLKLAVHVPESDVVCAVDTNALEKVLLNVFTNAVKFTPPGGSIDVTLAAARGNAIIEVKDTGIGIAREHLPRIFDRFGQLDSSSTRKYAGVGIGLALSKDLVEAHGGHIFAESDAGKGTTMRVELPLTESPAAAPVPQSTDALSEVHRAARRTLTVENTAEMQAVGKGDKTVLIVEDEPDLRRFLTALLAREYRVIQAADGLAGYELAMRERPDLALLDLMLPGMDGLDLCAQLRSTEGMETLKIVLLTARTDEQSKMEGLERGANDFLTKPFSSLEVRKRLHNLLVAGELEENLRTTNQRLETTLRNLRETEAQLVQSEKINALGTLSAGLLHEINNPLNFTLTAVEIAQQEAAPEVQETLSDIQQGMRRIRDIVSDLRTFAYPERAGNHTDFDVLNAINMATRMTAFEIKDCTLKVDVQPGTRAFGAQNHVVQVLINLLTNAAKAIGKTDRAGEIFLTACDRNGRAVVKVKDNGSGIAETALKNVFDPFYTTGQPGEGMGLGLSICHTIVKNHGGNMTVNSVEGHWTEVTFDLPSANQEP